MLDRKLTLRNEDQELDDWACAAGLLCSADIVCDVQVVTAYEIGKCRIIYQQ
jgi:hypothetical protein